MSTSSSSTEYEWEEEDPSSCGYEGHKHGTLLIDSLQGIELKPDHWISSRMAPNDGPERNVSTFSPLPLEWEEEDPSSCGYERHKHGTSLIDSLQSLERQPDQRNSSTMVYNSADGLVSSLSPIPL